MSEGEPKNIYPEIHKKAHTPYMEVETKLQREIVVQIRQDYKLTKSGPKGEINEYIPGLYNVLDKMEDAIVEYGFEGKHPWSVPLNEGDILVLAQATQILDENNRFFSGISKKDYKPVFKKTFRSILRSYENASGSLSPDAQKQIQKLGL